MNIFRFKKNKINIDYIDDIINLDLVKDLRKSKVEKIYAIFLKKDDHAPKKYTPITHFEYGTGDEYRIFEESFKPQIVPEVCKMFDADAIVMLHNHPTINGKISRAYPSKDDIVSTIEVGEHWQSQGCYLLDHIIINEKKHYSFLENGLINIFE